MSENVDASSFPPLYVQLLWTTLAYVENVGCQFLFLRQSGCYEFSLARFDVMKEPNIRGLSQTNLRTTRPRLRPEILSVRPFLSKPPDCAD
jgi:hypothetical protein